MMSARYKLLVGILVALVLIVLPLFLPTYPVFVLTTMLIFAIFAMSQDIMMGYLGFTSFGHAAFFGMGAYAVVISALRLGQSFGLNLSIGLIAVVVMALLFGLVALRTSGLQFIMISLALAQGLWGLAYRWVSVTGGDNGLSGLARPQLPIVGSLSDPYSYYYFVLVVFAIVLGVLSVLVRSPFGLSWRGIRDSEIRMQMLGYHTWFHKYVAYVISGFFGGVAGILNAYLTGYVSPDAISLNTSAMAILTVILGGPGTLLGPTLGAAVVILMRQAVSSVTDRWSLVLGAIYILTIMFLPGGLLGTAARILGRVKVPTKVTAPRQQAGSAREKVENMTHAP
jgi:branched-chain amino acid transport system permease protein